MYIFAQKNILLISIAIIEVGNGSWHTLRSTWDDGYTAHPI